MTPSARVQAAIDILDTVIAAARDGGAAADTLIARWFQTRRFAGSKDRRAVRAHVYAAIRNAGERPHSGRAAMLGLAKDDPALAALFDGSTYGPAPIDPKERYAKPGSAPGWLVKLIDPAELAALNGRAPLDIRVNRLRSDRATVAAMLPDAVPTPQAPDGLRLPDGVTVDALPGWADGLFEVQDEGSQIVSGAAGARPGMTVVDLCAGAGGKTLALAAAMANEGRIIACDIDRGRLSRLAPRAARAGVTIAETRLLDGGREAEAIEDLRGRADIVLIDAPCSGTGTWRRNPEARWRLTPDRLDRLVAVQAGLLDLGALLVRPGGALCYIVCSLLDREGGDQLAAFAARNTDWTIDTLALPAGRAQGGGVRLGPASDGTDGFFVARLRRAC
jgi:16S rRNA (cytosine967-C5)-methyltransferase